MREKGVPAGPPLVAPGPTEMPVTPVSGADVAADMETHTFNAEQYAALARLSELVAPSRDEVPGAREAEAPAFLDFLIGKSPDKTIRLYQQGLDELNAQSRRRYGKPFGDIELGSGESRLLASLDQPWQMSDPAEVLAKFLRTARGDIIRATLNSRSYIEAVSQVRRSRQGSGFYWYPMQ